jgi:hypothetical protein
MSNNNENVKGQYDLSKLSPDEKKALDEFMEELFTMAILARKKGK